MAFKMAAKSPLMKQLTGAQEKLPAGLKSAIEAAPESPAKNMNKGYGSPAKNMNKGYGTPSPMKAEMALSIEDSNYKKEMKAAKSPAKEIDDRPRSNNRTKQKTVNLKSKKGSIPTPKGAKLKPIGERPAQKSNLDRALDQKNQDVKDANDDQLNEYNKNPFNPNTTGQIGGRDQAPQSDYRPRPIELTKPKDSEMSDGTPRAENSRSFVSKDRMIKPEDSRMVDGTPTRENNKSVISMAQMRMNSNVGIKSKSPMKKGYFNGK